METEVRATGHHRVPGYGLPEFNQVVPVSETT
jgi:hypothetical protein